MIVADQCAIPHEFYEYVTSFSSMQDNRRPPQPIGKRKILSSSGVFTTEWGYPARNYEWGGMCARGREQSPVDFDLDVMTSMKNQRSLMDMVQGGTQNFKGHDTGHTLKWEMAHKSAGITYKNKFWKLQQFHVHTTSEHTIAGGSYDLEIVLVHKNDQGRILNIAILCKGEAFGDNEFFNNLRHSFTPLGKSSGFNMDYRTTIIGALGDPKQYMRYRGSITIPPCTEGVEWIVSASLMKVPQDFLIWLKQFKSMKYNFRPPQALNDRTIYVRDDVAVASAWNTSSFSTTQLLQLYSGLGLLMIGIYLVADCRRKDPMEEPLIVQHA